MKLIIRLFPFILSASLVLILEGGSIAYAQSTGKFIAPIINFLNSTTVCPQNAEIPNNGLDDDCDDRVDEVNAHCDAELNLTDPNAISAAKALDICNEGSSENWGLISTSYTRANGDSISRTEQHGIQAAFGDNVVPRFGGRMLQLSTGTARTIDQTDACGDFSCGVGVAGTPLIGYPQNVPGCAVGTNIYDDISLEVTLKAPANATGFEFSYLFTSFEFPEYVCQAFNDQFIVHMTPAPPGSTNGNIASDSLSNPISVNFNFFDHCDPASFGSYSSTATRPNPYCPEGDSIMDGTGYNEWSNKYAGSTGWLKTRAPVPPGSEFTLKFQIWDTGDHLWDSSVIIDNFHWLDGKVFLGTQPD